ncbi:HAD family hydrolase [Paracoccus sp. NBH48]|uniref:HAD family hydrolase n=1 Tax=Paracoccus sp. NBH48 TaxID=2596918 RepID=UPI0021032FD8|nr:HAD family hydrolase [Paracoccus sp. NBH48]
MIVNRSGSPPCPPRPILVFDVNETLLDLDHLCPLFDDIFGDGAVMRDWFAQLILYSQTLTITGLRSDFATLAVAVLRMIGEIRGVAITEGHEDALRRTMGTLPAHPDAETALVHLRDRGFRLVTLTNSPPSAGGTALDRSGLAQYFEASFSVQPTNRFKPAPQTINWWPRHWRYRCPIFAWWPAMSGTRSGCRRWAAKARW